MTRPGRAKDVAMTLHVLILEGNVAADRAAYAADYGQTASQSYAATVRELAPDAECAICFAADAGASLPQGVALGGFDAVFVTGSALNLYDGGPEIERQIDFARAVFDSRVPFFGSCWGLQIATAAAGGVVAKNPKGREIGFARDIRLTEAGRAHPLLAGRAASFDAPCCHLDHVETMPEGAILLASNAVSQVQALEIVFDGGRFWGVQYHPEYSLSEIGSIMARRAPALAREGLFPNEAAAKAYAEDLKTFETAPDRRDIAARLSLGADLIEPKLRRRELGNFLDLWVRPAKAARGSSRLSG